MFIRIFFAMRIKELLVDGKSLKSKNQINNILKSKKFFWLIDSEIEDAIIEIKNDTIVWHSGDFYHGNWKYGIFKNGNFYGKFINGIFENGNFNGEWQSGINLKDQV